MFQLKNHVLRYFKIVFRPNVCRSRFRNYCCPGWSLKHATGLCIVREYNTAGQHKSFKTKIIILFLIYVNNYVIHTGIVIQCFITKRFLFLVNDFTFIQNMIIGFWSFPMTIQKLVARNKNETSLPSSSLNYCKYVYVLKY